jgi:hypothetical protein
MRRHRIRKTFARAPRAAAISSAWSPSGDSRPSHGATSSRSCVRARCTRADCREFVRRSNVQSGRRHVAEHLANQLRHVRFAQRAELDHARTSRGARGKREKPAERPRFAERAIGNLAGQSVGDPEGVHASYPPSSTSQGARSPARSSASRTSLCTISPAHKSVSPTSARPIHRACNSGSRT